jgi:hypothetical protein
MLSHAAADIGYGTAFGIHEALDQFGATLGPLAIAAALAFSAGGYRLAFAPGEPGRKAHRAASALPLAPIDGGQLRRPDGGRLPEDEEE